MKKAFVATCLVVSSIGALFTSEALYAEQTFKVVAGPVQAVEGAHVNLVAQWNEFKSETGV